MAEEILAQSRETHERRQAQRLAVEREIDDDWAAGWELFDAIIYAAQQSGGMLINRCSEANDDYGDVRDALSRIHSAGTLILQEIHAVLRAGLWGASGARWRALHELGISAAVIVLGGPETARRYIDHGFVVQTRRLSRFYANQQYGPVDEVELKQREVEASELAEQHTLPTLAAASLTPMAGQPTLCRSPKMARRFSVLILSDLSE